MSKPTGKLIRVTPEGIGAVSTGNIIQATGDSPTKIMSQKAVTDALKTSVNIDSIYPIGIVVWFAQNKNPNTLFPGTKWQYIGENKTIRLANSDGSNVLKGGGSDTITLTEAQLPAHNHTFSATTALAGAHTHTRGTMNILGGIGADRHTGSLDGAYFFGTNPTNKGNTGNFGGAWTNDAIRFDASRNWTGETSNNGNHTHSVSGTTGSKGNGIAVSIVNAYVMLMGWYRIS